MNTQILIVGLYTIAMVLALVIFLPKKANKDQDVTDFTAYMKELNLRKQRESY